MKICFVLSVAVLICLVNRGDCGVVSDVYGNVRDKTVAFTDGVGSWYSYGKDLLLGNPGKPKELASGDEVAADAGVLNSIYGSLLSGFQSARDNVYGFFMSDDTKKNNGFISNIYDKVKDRINRITTYVVGEDAMDNYKTDDLKEVRRVLNKIINEDKNKPESNLNAGLELFKDKVGEIGDKVHVRVEEVMNNPNDMKTWVGDHVSGVPESINKGVNDAKASFDSTLEHLEKSGIVISDKEREILNTIAQRLYGRTKDAEDPKKLSY